MTFYTDAREEYDVPPDFEVPPGTEDARHEGNGQDADADAKPRFGFVTDTELEALPAPDWLAAGIIINESVVQIVGAPGSMKSFAALDLAAHVRLGRPWHGRQVTAGPVLYVLAEGVRSFGLRVRAWRLHHDLAGPIGLRFLPGPVQLANPAEVSELLAAIAHLEELPRLVIIDTQARCSVGLEENSARDMGMMLAGAERIQRVTKAVVALVHHTPRDLDRERGSTAQRGGVDATLLVTADGDHITMKVDRQKDGESGDVIAWRKRIIETDILDASGHPRTSCVLIPFSETEQHREPRGVGDLPASVRALLDALRVAPDGSTASSTLHKVIGLRDRTFFLALRKAKDWGLIDGTAKGYRLTPAGRELLG